MLPVSLVMLMALLLVSEEFHTPAPQRTGRGPAHAGTHSADPPGGARQSKRRVGRRSGPELALEPRTRFLEGARVGPGGQVLPPAVGDDEADVGPPAGGDLLVGDAQRRVQDRAGRDAGEDALAL